MGNPGLNVFLCSVLRTLLLLKRLWGMPLQASAMLFLFSAKFIPLFQSIYLEIISTRGVQTKTTGRGQPLTVKRLESRDTKEYDESRLDHRSRSRLHFE